MKTLTENELKDLEVLEEKFTDFKEHLETIASHYDRVGAKHSAAMGVLSAESAKDWFEILVTDYGDKVRPCTCGPNAGCTAPCDRRWVEA